MEREHVRERAGSPVRTAGRRAPSQGPVAVDLVRLQRLAGNRAIARMFTFRRGLESLRAGHNQEQAALPGKAEVIGLIKADLDAIDRDPVKNIGLLTDVRQDMDVVLSVFSDGLGVRTATAAPDPVRLERQSDIKQKLVDARVFCETAYHRLLKLPEPVGPEWEAAVRELRASRRLWYGIVQDKIKTEVRETLDRTVKDGKREAGGASGTGQIDTRSDELVKVLRADAFIPHLLVGLPTAGAHVAARIAGALNASAASPAAVTELVTFRPRYVKESADTDAVDPNVQVASERLAEAHRSILAADLARLQLPPSPELRVLVVDDFSSSGDSIASAKDAIRAALGQGVEVRAAVSRYNFGQIGPRLREHKVNPIDYMVGPVKSGTREEVEAHIGTDDDRMEAAQEDGWTDPRPKPWWRVW
ncbi:hypothetical protein Afil01_57990 [Actinorhabdospora filicis]|uniref:Phosphoribosyltransferase n=1 Tax=Actinorhabdospora filicis TaxID=1785913 RepID=A0A9W6W607_9ACTN|nr:hypothetical protein [Actinorhabdospora filicis]GLZ80992.1 hypothetical protein Afil01_57990 [Actinorhabdospora filicis]